MTSRHYDVVVLGSSLGALATAAVLARRDFRVLLLGQGQRGASYRHDRFSLLRRTFTLLGNSSPAMKRLLHELAQSPRFRRRTQTLDPMFVLSMPGRRVEVAPDVDLFSREVDREFPEVRQLVDELYATFARANAAADSAFERDAIWPPAGFWERLETGRAAAMLPFSGSAAPRDLLGKFPSGHPFRDAVTVPVGFATDLALPLDQMPPLVVARLHGAWTRGVSCLDRGEDELTEFLAERIEAHGGECRLGGRASRILLDRGRASGVMEDGEDEPTGADAVVCAFSGEGVADLTSGEGITRQAREQWPRVTASTGRFVVSLVVKRAGLPEPLGVESFLLPRAGPRPDPRRPVVHLQRMDALSPAPDETVLAAEMLLPLRGPLTLLEAREAVRLTLEEHLPFLDRHVVALDSPHDGLPLIDRSSGAERSIDRVHLPDSGPGPEPMRWQWSVEPAGYLEIAGEPVRGPIPGTYLVGTTVLPGLGQEGELIAAWAAARLITEKDGRRQKMRRQMWTKIET
ncbi:MAG: NAD(P)/FAD-dependent oxidoreductase [Polyangiaceae bacterium]|nr:NAD(P)/FAD-dependent oxidoreductase [Polyangiaceae bacterium]